ncbi:MAG: glycoside hydrolase family 3 protein, partial [Deltaproteobacteria bacterium]|nr:glycoside hydrolase family 3 protein [Deltaproteobacteria bacterium]
MKITVRRAATFAAVVFGVGGLGMVWMDRQLPAVANPELWPAPARPTALLDPALEARVEARLAAMTLTQKVGQTVQADIGSIDAADLAKWPLGSILVGGDGGPGRDDRAPVSEWLALTQQLHAAAAAQGGPGLLVGVDAVHGHNNLVGAVIFPHNIGLGAAREPELAGRIASATAESMAATGMNWNFAPTLAVPRDARWGRTYEGFGGDPALVASYAGPVVRGYQGDPGQPVAPDRVAATAKHFLGDGGTDQGTDQGDTRLGEAELIEVHAQAYRAAIDAGVLT